ncbi:uncharacterized protein LOC133719969 [Rosa rugosa]|uniref:uncharacterized protein LOC133719969 n=1 Tax=Rosa rugosa TaxID=74645 RepID=UPI002B406B42|nr:uncharacterized protein LOC133719969 [Rosa rugosa]XP_062002154.1 uncharacterized protein LOC133719969 [Rosa rugosa]
MVDMSLSTSHSSHDNQGSDAKTALHLRDPMRETKSSFGFFSDSDILVWLKGLAIDSGYCKASPGSAQQLWNQSLELRKLLLLANDVSPRSKRKLDQFLRGGRFAGASELETKKSDDHVKRICRGHSVSCSTNTDGKNEIFRPQILCSSLMSGNSLTNEDEYRAKQCCPDLTILDDMEKYGAPYKDNSASPLIDADESVHGSSTLSLEKSNFCDATTLKVNDSVDSSDSFSLDEYDSELERALRLLVSSDDDLRRSVTSAHPTTSLSSEERNHKACEILRCLFSDGKYFRRSVPIGRDFQADVPKWIGPVNRNKLYSEDGDSKVSRWLGTLIWPIKGRKCGGATIKAIGKGRPESCSCVSPGSVDCVKHHIHEARLCLQSEIGPAFCSWKFDEMGEFASKSWTLKEQRTFESLVRTNPISNEASFWKLAFKRFPNKRKKSIVSYYYNVFIPRRMSLETRSSLDEIDSDDDSIEV